MTEAAKLESTEVLNMVRTQFANPLNWEPGGWGSGDRRCIVGTIRNKTGHGLTDTGGSIKAMIDTRAMGRREPWFTAYEEVIFACASIVEVEFDPMAQYWAIRSQFVDGWKGEHEAILVMLDNAEATLIQYNDQVCSSAAEMQTLVAEATEIVRAQRKAREAEFYGGKDAEVLAAAQAANPRLKPDQVVFASAEDSKAAEEEYKERQKLNPNLPPVWPLWGYMNSSKGKAKRKRSYAKLIAARLKAREKGVDAGSTFHIKNGGAVR